LDTFLLPTAISIFSGFTTETYSIQAMIIGVICGWGGMPSQILTEWTIVPFYLMEF